MPDIETAILWATESLRHGGRIIYIGAGTSGRLGVLDGCRMSAYLLAVPYDRVVGLIAGGAEAFVKS